MSEFPSEKKNRNKVKWIYDFFFNMHSTQSINLVWKITKSSNIIELGQIGYTTSSF